MAADTAPAPVIKAACAPGEITIASPPGHVTSWANQALLNLGAILSSLGHHEEAVLVTEKAVAITSSLRQANPALACAHASALNNLSNRAFEAGLDAQALQASAEAIAVALAGNPPNKPPCPEAAGLLRNGIRLALGRGEPGKAKAWLEEKINLSSSATPVDVEAALDLARSHAMLARLHLMTRPLQEELVRIHLEKSAQVILRISKDSWLSEEEKNALSTLPQELTKTSKALGKDSIMGPSRPARPGAFRLDELIRDASLVNLSLVNLSFELIIKETSSDYFSVGFERYCRPSPCPPPSRRAW
ncbi:MAG: hypothetical protein VKN13_06690 [Cyanobacteriota bacterium]|nr:hypothetical protein [Cyanobacteriota bacterium]